MKFNACMHILGKVYDLTQENMQAMVIEIDRLRATLEDIRYHSIPPFEGQRWLNYVHDVSKEALEGPKCIDCGMRTTGSKRCNSCWHDRSGF